MEREWNGMGGGYSGGVIDQRCRRFAVGIDLVAIG